MPKEKEKINVKEKLVDNTLDLSLCDLSEVPVKQIVPLKRATILDLSNNRLTFIGKDFATLTHIVKLDLSKNQINMLCEEFGKFLLNLRHLDLYNNKLERLPISFGNLQKLKYLDLKGNPLIPALSKLIGPCTNQKECMTAAKNAVSFMGELELKVKEEQQKDKEAREKAENEERLINEEATKKKKAQESQELKKEAKQNKKKKSNKINKEIENLPAAPIKNEIETKTSVKKSKKQKLAENEKKQKLYNSFVAFLVLVFCMMVFQVVVVFFYPQLFDNIVEYIPKELKVKTVEYFEYGKEFVHEMITKKQ